MQFTRMQNVFALAALAILASCTPQNPQDLKEKTARATAEMKRDAKAVAAGIREGWSRDKPLNLNTATKEQLITLPGVTGSEADRIMAARPYQKVDDLLSRHILSKGEYGRIADLVTVK